VSYSATALQRCYDVATQAATLQRRTLQQHRRALQAATLPEQCRSVVLQHCQNNAAAPYYNIAIAASRCNTSTVALECCKLQHHIAALP